MAKYKELLEKIADEALRAELDAEYSSLSKEKGENGRKLMEKDSEMSKLREKLTESASYSEAFAVLKSKGVNPKDIPAMLDKLKVTKTLEDDLTIASHALAERDSELKELRNFKKTVEVRTAVGKYIAEEKANFKNEKGEQIKLLERFIPEDKLYADIDISNEVLIRERVKSVLKDGLQMQEAVAKEFGFQGNAVHQIPEGKGGVGVGVPVSSQLKEVAQKQGLEAAMAKYLELKGSN